jgi:site-specific recombinase XerD
MDTGKKFPAEVLTQDEVRALYRQTSLRCPTGIRNRALIFMGWRAGLRVSEALDLMPRDVNLQEGYVHVRHGKGDKARIVGLDETTCAVLQRWLDKRTQLGFNGRHPLFCTLHGERMKDAYMRELLPRLARKAGIEKRVHYHGLRHTFAWELSKEGKIRVREIQGLLGHASLATTATYLDHLAPHDLINAIRERSAGQE